MATKKTRKSSTTRKSTSSTGTKKTTSTAKSTTAKADAAEEKKAEKAATTDKAPEPKKAEPAKAEAPKAVAAKAAAPKAAAAKVEAKPAASKAEPAKSAAKPAPKAAAKPAAKAETKAEKPTAPKPAEKPAAKAAAKAEPAKVEKAPEAPKSAPAKPAPKATAPKAEAKKAEHAKPEPKPAVKPAPKAEAAKPAAPKPSAKPEPAKAEAKPVAKPTPKAEPKAPEPEKKAEAKPAPKVTEPAKAEPKPEPAKAETPAEKPVEKKPEPKAADKPVEKKAEPAPAPKAEAKPEPAPAPKAEAKPEPEPAPAPEPEEPPMPEPRRSVAFIGSECYPFVKTGGLGDVMYALPKALIPENCDVKVILPKYACIKQEYKDKMVYKGSFDMDLCSDGTKYYVGIMEYEADGVVYDFIDNEWFFNSGNPYTNLVDDIPKYCYFAKAALSALLYLDWIPDIIHCHDWQASLVPIYLKTMFQDTPLGHSKSILTIHNLRFQGKYSLEHIQYWSGLPAYTFNEGALQENWTDANMLKGGLAYADMITTVSGNYAREIQTPEYGEGLDAHLRYHSGKLRGIVNGIDIDIWNPKTDKLLDAPYDSSDVLEQKKQDKAFLQHELGLEEDPDKMVIGLISRLTNQKGLDLVNDIFQQMLDGNTQVVILGTGDHQYEDSFRWFENANKGTVCSNIMYDEARSHQIYAGADALLVPSRFEPCGLTQLIAMHYGTVPIVRETGGLKDTVQPYNKYTDEGNGFSFDRYESGLLLDAINRAKTLYFTDRYRWDEMVVRDMEKDVSWANSAKLYRNVYMELTH